MDPFVAEIRIFGFNFAPRGWAFCNGQLLPLSQNTALFSLLGTTYGGNGLNNFALPDLQGSTPVFWGQGPGLSLYSIGETGGTANVTLQTSEIPSHNHGEVVRPTAAVPPLDTPVGNAGGRSNSRPYNSTGPNGAMGATAVGLQGGSQPHNNLMPYLTLNFCIALQGVFPPRTWGVRSFGLFGFNCIKINAGCEAVQIRKLPSFSRRGARRAGWLGFFGSKEHFIIQASTTPALSGRPSLRRRGVLLSGGRVPFSL